MQPSQKFAIRNDLSELTRCINGIRGFMEAQGASERAILATQLVLDEVITNTIRHGCEVGAEHRLQVSISVENQGFVLVFTDDGRAFNPLEHPEPEAPRSLQETPIGGIGIKIVRRMSSAMDYERRGRENRLEVHIPCPAVAKHRPGRSEPSQV